MSAKLISVSYIENVKGIKNFLVPSLSDSSSNKNDENVGWDSEWGWEDVDMSSEDASESQGSNWLEEILISVSPVGDVIAMAKDKKLIILTQTFNPDNKSDNDSSHFLESYKGQHNVQNDNTDVITSVLCVPLSSQKKSSHGYPDWTCIVVGYSTGYVKFFEDNGGEIMSQLFHNKPVKKISVKTYEPWRHSLAEEQNEELTLLYTDVLVVVKGFSLFQTLRACRNHLARAAAGGQSLNEAPQLEFKKWGLQDQLSFCDHISPGVSVPSMFDRMVTASLLGGPYAHVQANQLKHNVYVTAGREPYIGFYYAAEGAWTPVLSEIAVAVANKVKHAIYSATSLGSWFGVGSSQSSGSTDKTAEGKKPSKLEPATGLALRYGLPDKRREGVSLVLAGDFRTAVVTDSFGRVTVVDVTRGCAIRVWKGYREAEVGFLEVEEGGEKRRCVHYLVIHAPRRGILEVWACQQGPRVAAFNVAKGGRLLHSGYKLVGLNNDTYKSVKVSSLQRVYFLKADGELCVFDIPFHLCLTDRNSHRTHDYHLLKQLRLILKKHSEDSDDLDDEISEILKQFKLVGCLELGVDRLLNAKYLSTDFVVNKINEVIQMLETESVCRQSASVDKQRLVTYLRSFITLFDAYSVFQSLLVDPGAATASQFCLPGVMEESEEEKVQSLSDLLCVELVDAHRCRILFSLCRDELVDMSRLASSGGGLPSLLLPGEIAGLEYIDWFFCQMDGRSDDSSILLSSSPSQHQHHLHPGVKVSITFHANITPEKKMRMGRFLFESCFHGVTTVDIVIHALGQSTIPVNLALSSLVTYYLSGDRCQLEESVTLKSLVCGLLRLSREEHLTAEDLVHVFSSLRAECLLAHNLSAVLLFAMVARCSILEEWTQINSLMSMEDEEKDANSYDLVQAEISEWDVTCSRLEDLLRLHLFLNYCPLSAEVQTQSSTEGEERMDESSGDVSSLGHPAPQQFPGLGERLSLTRVLEAGRGLLSELMGRWGVHYRLNVGDIEALYRSLGKDLVDDDSRRLVNKRLSRTEQLFHQVYEHLPNSLEFDSVLANMAWENIVFWSKDIEDVAVFTRAVEFLGKLGPGGAMVVHGVCSMMWDMHLLKPFQSATYLADKEAKPLKDRLTRKEVGMSERSLAEFMKTLTKFIDVFIFATENSEVVPAFGVEREWHGVGNRVSLVELAVERPTVNTGLLHHHQQLVYTLAPIILFRMKGYKPLALFDTRGVQCFFKSLTSRPVLPTNSSIDMAIENRRCRFLEDLLHAAVEHFSSSGSGDPYVYHYFVSVALRLATLWNLDTDRVHRQHVVALSSAAMDTQAEVCLSRIRDTGPIATELMLIVGQRLGHRCFPQDESDEDMRIRALLTPSLTTWIRSTNYRELKQPNVSLESTHKLMQLVMHHLPENCAEYRIALQLIDFLQRVHQSSSSSLELDS